MARNEFLDFDRKKHSLEPRTDNLRYVNQNPGKVRSGTISPPSEDENP